jgi:hypothetical protein
VSEPIDLGLGHTLRFYSWGPDRILNPQYAGIPDVDRAGAIITHVKPDGERCEGSIWFDVPETSRISWQHAKWTVVSWDPLTLDPSILCHCGDHGHVREGRWVPA